MTPAARYREAIERGELLPDSAQADVVDGLERLHASLLDPAAPGSAGLLARLRGLLGSAPGREPIRGLYLWGDVGRGKTVLVNMLHDALPFAEKRRIHFHAFMQRVHDERRTLGRRRDPLAEVARRLAADTRVLFFDEFHVSDIADAMLLGRVLEALFARAVTLVATSNVAPDDLYREGLQRARFLPAIDLLKRHTAVVRIGSETDYRLRALERAEIYHAPLDEAAERSLASSFAGLAPASAREDTEIRIAGRAVPVRRIGEGVAWFEFEVLCAGPRATSDYVEIARRCHTVLLGNVPCMDDGGRDQALRFVHLVDVLYEHNVNLIVSAAAAPAELYRGVRLAIPFARASSRLEEMRSRDYLARPHLP